MSEHCETASDEDRLVAMLAHLLTIPGYGLAVAQYLIPLVIFFMYREKSRFVAFHALQSLFFHLALLGIVLVLGLLVALTFGFGVIVAVPLVFATWIGGIVYPIIAGVKTYGGSWYEYPMVGAAVRRSVDA